MSQASPLPITNPEPAREPAPGGRRTWTVYLVRRRRDGRAYVDVTRRRVAARIGMHQHMARLRLPHGGPGPLVAAIREAYAAGLAFDEAFEVETVAQTDTREAALRLQTECVDRLGAQLSQGFYFMPAG
jgi:hypothetical protein